MASARSSWRPPWLETTTPGGPVLDRERRVLGGQQPLDQHRQAALGGELLEVGPGQRRVDQREGLLDRDRPLGAERGGDAGHAELGGDREAGAQVALAVAAARARRR